MVQQRRIHYNFQAENAPENVFAWYFLIVNEPREINLICQRLYEQLKPIDDIQEFDKGNVVQVRSLHYLYLTFKSPVLEEDLDKRAVYGGMWKKDKRLYRRKRSASQLSILEAEGLVAKLK